MGTPNLKSKNTYLMLVVEQLVGCFEGEVLSILSVDPALLVIQLDHYL